MPTPTAAQPYALLDAIPLGVFVVDADYVVRFWNSTLEDWTGLPREQTVGSPLLNHYPHLLARRYTARLDGIFQGGPPTIFSSQLHRHIIPVRTPAGNYCVQHTTVTAVAAPGTPGQYHAMFSIQDVTDLTERIHLYREMRDEALGEVQARRKIEAALRDSEARYRDLSELISDFAFSLVRGQNGEYTREWVTDAFVYITGYPTDEFRTLHDWQRMIHPEDMPDVQRIFRTLHVAWADEHLEHRMITKGGETRHIQISLRPVVDYTTKQVVKILGAVQDITRRKLVEERLRLSELRFRHIAENLDVVIYTLDPITHEVRYVNPAYEQITGLTRRLLYHGLSSYLRLVHPEDIHLARAGFMLDVPPINEEVTYRIQPKTGPIRWVRQRSLHIESNNDPDQSIIGLIEDITDQREANEREFALALEREQMALLSSFISDATHEFRTPLSVINSSSYLLGRLDDPAKRERYTTLIQQQVNSISELVDVLVFMIGLEKNMEGTPEPVDVNSVFRMVLDPMAVRIREAQHTTETAFHPTPLTVRGHASQLWQALVALVENAIRYTPPPGKITLTSTQVGQEAVLEVRDTGVGITPEDMDRIFDRFYRVDTAHSTRGFGLGLPIARKIIVQHGGEIEAESTVGQGSTFRVRLPLTAKAPK